MKAFTDRIPRRWGAREWEHTLVYYVRAGGWRLRGAGWGFSEEGTWLWHRHMPQGAPHTLPTLARPAVPSYTVTEPAERWPHPWEPYSHRSSRGREIEESCQTSIALVKNVFFCTVNIDIVYLLVVAKRKVCRRRQKYSKQILKQALWLLTKLLPLTPSQQNSG